MTTSNFDDDVVAEDVVVDDDTDVDVDVDVDTDDDDVEDSGDPYVSCKNLLNLFHSACRFDDEKSVRRLPFLPPWNFDVNPSTLPCMTIVSFIRFISSHVYS